MAHRHLNEDHGPTSTCFIFQCCSRDVQPNTPFAALTQWVDVSPVTYFLPIKLAHLEAIATALHRSPAAFLVDSDEAAAIVEQIASNQERCLQVLFFLETLAEQPDEVDAASEAPAS